MSEMIVRFKTGKADAELCIRQGGKIIFKNLSVKKLTEILEDDYASFGSHGRKSIEILDKQIVGCGKNYVVINQPERKKIVTFAEKGSYKISFPNALYILQYGKRNIKNIKAFAYVEYKGADTELYEYPMPNELSGNDICLGSADRSIKENDYIGALEKIIATPYTHTRFSGIRGFTDSLKWFEYLQKNKFPYKLLRPLKLKLKDVKI